MNLHSRIDFIFISSELNFASQKIKIIPFPFSDHDGVIMTLKVSEPERGPGLWKMNYTLFKQIYLSTYLKVFGINGNFRKITSKINWNGGSKLRLK